MYTQLTLIESTDDTYDWTIDAETRAIGRTGLRSARAVLAAAAARAEATVADDLPLAA